MKSFMKQGLFLLAIAGLFAACSDNKAPIQPQVTEPGQTALERTQGASSADSDAAVYQAAGSTIESIQETVGEYRVALGQPNNGNQGPLTTGHREINWDGGSTENQTTSISGNPSITFKVNRGAIFTTPDGTGFIQAPPIADSVLFPPGFDYTRYKPTRLQRATGSVTPWAAAAFTAWSMRER